MQHVLETALEKKSEADFRKLPENILLNIFHNFSETEIVKCISPVCQNWRYTCRKPDLWKNLNVVGRHVSVEDICYKLRQFPKLEKIFLKNVIETSVVLIQIGRTLTNIQHLTIRHCYIEEPYLRVVVASCKNLKFLDLKGCKLKAYKLYEELGCLKFLKSLNLSENPYLTIQNLNTVVTNCRHLQEFYVSVFNPVDKKIILQDHDCLFLLSKMPDLRKVVLDALHLTNTAFQSLFMNTKIEFIGFYGAYNLTSEVFLKFPSSFPNLKRLRIRFPYEIKPEEITTFFENGKETLKQLEEFEFMGSRINDEGLKKMSTVCQNLESLIVRSCLSITDITSVLENCKKLEIINVAFCGNLVYNFEIPKNLKSLFVDNSKKSMEFVDELYDVKEYDGDVTICISRYNKKIVEFNKAKR